MALIPKERIDHDPPRRRVGKDGVERFCLSTLKCWDGDEHRWFPFWLRKRFLREVTVSQYWTAEEIAQGLHLNGSPPGFGILDVRRES